MQQGSVLQYVDDNDDLFNLFCGSTQSVILPPNYVGGHSLECLTDTQKYLDLHSL